MSDLTEQQRADLDQLAMLRLTDPVKIEWDRRIRAGETLSEIYAAIHARVMRGFRAESSFAVKKHQYVARPRPYTDH